jgi:hypothetical protein
MLRPLVDVLAHRSFRSVMRVKPRLGLVAPVPLLILFGAFLAAIVYLIAASLTRRDAPVFPVSPRDRTRAADWERVGDTLTIDATDGERWQYVSLARGRVLTLPDTAGWDIAVQRYRVITPPSGAIADAGATTFEHARPLSGAPFTRTTVATEPENTAIKHWYRYNLLTHLLEPNGHVYVVRARSGALWKLAVLSYYCPRLQAGCLTVRYAPVLRQSGLSGVAFQSNGPDTTPAPFARRARRAARRRSPAAEP